MADDRRLETVEEFVTEMAYRGEPLDVCEFFRTELPQFVSWFEVCYPDTLFPAGLTKDHLRVFIQFLKDRLLEMRIDPWRADDLLKLKLAVVGTFCAWLAAESYVNSDPTDSIPELVPILTPDAQERH